MRPNAPKLIFAVLLSFYFLWIAWDPMQGSFLDNVDLPIHETGHLLFRPFGEFMMIAGGSLFQVIFPLVFAGYFAWRRQFYSMAIVMLWVGQSILNVWVYASDAIVMQLVLTSGFTGSEGSFHDWNYLLTATGLLESTKGVAKVIRFVGTFTIIIAGISAIYFSFITNDEEV
ncbi:MAG: hypothetical protein KA956_08495 [Pyrinomonadaceae bacterium]|nr:hypothetical protein [Acidobacteriota bacterium]MBK7933015.1 hypothetical protein [Acidobacteriota bacterium]MBP7376505.1 hypothetical protein [Pyrinomonadaceae bacterium]